MFVRNSFSLAIFWPKRVCEEAREPTGQARKMNEACRELLPRRESVTYISASARRNGRLHLPRHLHRSPQAESQAHPSPSPFLLTPLLSVQCLLGQETLPQTHSCSGGSLPSSLSTLWRVSLQVRPCSSHSRPTSLLTCSPLAVFTIHTHGTCRSAGLVDDNNLYEWDVMIIGCVLCAMFVDMQDPDHCLFL